MENKKEIIGESNLMDTAQKRLSELMSSDDNKQDSEEISSNKKEMIAALEEFSGSFIKISRLFEKEEFNGGDLPNVIDEYPFDISFDELNITEWCQTFIYELENQ